MAQKRLDLNLLPIAIALYDERSVGKAALKLGISQPAVSAASARLRTALDDSLFVRTPKGMDPTARTLAFIGTAKDVTRRIERDLIAPHSFIPENYDGTFTLVLSDAGEMVFLPRVVNQIQTLAPSATLRSVTLPPEELRLSLETGETDLAVGYFPDIEKGSFFQQRLFTHHFTCLLRADHPISVRAYRSSNSSHSVMLPSGRRDEAKSYSSVFWLREGFNDVSCSTRLTSCRCP